MYRALSASSFSFLERTILQTLQSVAHQLLAVRAFNLVMMVTAIQGDHNLDSSTFTVDSRWHFEYPLGDYIKKVATRKFGPLTRGF